MGAGLEREIKLRVENAASARAAILSAGGTLTHPRRLQQDAVLDTVDGALRRAGSVLRVRVEDAKAVLTFKGPVQPSDMKLREEIETDVSDAASLFTLLERLGFMVIYRYEKFREEFVLAGCVAAVDDTPIGTFVEIEGGEAAIRDAAALVGRAPADFVVESYRALYVQRCAQEGVPCADMVFNASARA